MASPAHWDRRAWGDVCVVPASEKMLAEISKEFGLEVANQPILVKPDGRPTTIEPASLRSFEDLWTELRLQGAQEGDARTRGFQAEHPANLDVRMLRIRHLLLRAALAHDGADTPAIARERILAARQEIDALPIDWAWYQHPYAQEITENLDFVSRSSTCLEAADLLKATRRRLARDLVGVLHGMQENSHLWLMYAHLLVPEEFPAALAALDQLPHVSGQAWPPPGPTQLAFAYSRAGRWDMVASLGAWGINQLRSVPTGSAAWRAAACRDWGRLHLEGLARQGRWNDAEAQVESLRSLLGPEGWEAAAGAWKSALRRASGTSPVPRVVLERLDQPAASVSLPVVPPEPPALEVLIADSAAPAIEDRRRTSLMKFLSERQTKWVRVSDQIVAWRVLEGTDEVASGSPTPVDLARLEQTVLGLRRPRVQEWRETLRRYPGNRTVQASLQAALGRRLPDSQHEDEWIQLTRELGIGPEAPNWTPPAEAWGPTARKEMIALEARLMASPMDARSWMAWIAWNKILTSPRHIADLVRQAPRCDLHATLAEDLPWKAWEAIAQDMAMLHRWHDLEVWSQARMPRPSGEAVSKEKGQELSAIGGYLAQARRGQAVSSGGKG